MVPSRSVLRELRKRSKNSKGNHEKQGICPIKSRGGFLKNQASIESRVKNRKRLLKIVGI